MRGNATDSITLKPALPKKRSAETPERIIRTALAKLQVRAKGSRGMNGATECSNPDIGFLNPRMSSRELLKGN